MTTYMYSIYVKVNLVVNVNKHLEATHVFVYSIYMVHAHITLTCFGDHNDNGL